MEHEAEASRDTNCCAMCHAPFEEGQMGDATDIGMMHSDPYTYDESSCYDAYLGGIAPD